jgi:transcriptional regulator with GAF, ATPase, and Fis domain
VCSDGIDGSPDTMLVGKDMDIPTFQTVLALPLVIQRKARGVLCLAHDVPQPVSAITQDFVRMAAEHLSLFLENLYVKCRLRDMHQESQTEQNGTKNTF